MQRLINAKPDYDYYNEIFEYYFDLLDQNHFHMDGYVFGMDNKKKHHTPIFYNSTAANLFLTST